MQLLNLVNDLVGSTNHKG